MDGSYYPGLANPNRFGAASVIVFAALTILSSTLYGAAPNHPPDKALESSNYWVFFRDKGFESDTRLQEALRKAESDLSERSRIRRQKVKPDALVDIADLPVNPHYLKEVTDLSGNSPRQLSRWLNAASFMLRSDQVPIVANLPIVKSVAPVRHFIRELPAGEVVQPDAIPPNRDHDFDYGVSLRQNSFLNVPELHDRGFLGQGVMIGIADAGFNNLNHQCFGELEVQATWDFVNGDEDVSDGDDAGSGAHGTKTLSILAGLDPGEFLGAAPHSVYVLAKTENTEVEEEVEEDNLVAGLEWLDSVGVDVISISLGYSNFHEYSELDGNTAVATIAADRAAEVGIVVVAAMGNSGREDYPINKMSSPADGREVLSIGALDRDSSIAAFSSLGPTYDGRIKPDFVSQGVSVYFASSLADDRYLTGSGTSFSTPAVAGLCALLIEADPNLTPAELRDKLRTCSNYRDNPDTLYGWGIPDGLQLLDLIQAEQARLVIPLEAGWNVISSNVVGAAMRLPDIFGDAIQRGHVLVVRNAAGRRYVPNLQINEIPFWNPMEGYQVCMNEPDSVAFEGIQGFANQPIPLSEGWHIVPYLPGFALPPQVAFQSLTDQGMLAVAVDERGDFYAPNLDFNNMSDLITGQGYRLMLEAQSVLVYPRRPERLNFSKPHRQPRFFTRPQAGEGGEFLVIFAPELGDGDEIAFFDDSELVGSGIVESGRCGVTLWREANGTLPKARLHRVGERDYELSPEWLSVEANDPGANLAFWELNLPEAMVKSNSGLSLIAQPNPFNDRLTVDFSSVNGGFVEFRIYDLMGRIMERQILRPTGSGHSGILSFDASKWPSGNYLLKAKAGDDERLLNLKHLK